MYGKNRKANWLVTCFSLARRTLFTPEVSKFLRLSWDLRSTTLKSAIFFDSVEMAPDAILPQVRCRCARIFSLSFVSSSSVVFTNNDMQALAPSTGTEDELEI